MLEAEKRYLSNNNGQTNAIVLAATRGDELEGLTLDKPKVMLPINGKPLLRHLIDNFKKVDIDNVTVVGGYKAETIDVPNIKLIKNADYNRTGELASLLCAKKSFQDNMIVAYGDLLFRSYIIRDLLNCEGEIVAVVDSLKKYDSLSGSPDYAYCCTTDEIKMFGQDVNLLNVSKDSCQSETKADGRWIGMLRFHSQGRKWLEEALDRLQTGADFPQMSLADLCNYLIQQGKPIKVFYIRGHWLDVNSLDDLDLAVQLQK